jgi:hypothetical protein
MIPEPDAQCQREKGDDHEQLVLLCLAPPLNPALYGFTVHKKSFQFKEYGNLNHSISIRVTTFSRKRCN